MEALEHSFNDYLESQGSETPESELKLIQSHFKMTMELEKEQDFEPWLRRMSAKKPAQSSAFNSYSFQAQPITTVFREAMVTERSTQSRQSEKRLCLPKYRHSNPLPKLEPKAPTIQ